MKTSMNTMNTKIITMTMINNNKKIIYRKPLLSNKLYDRDELIRVVRCKDNKVIIDYDKNILGRGAYILKDMDILAKIKKKNLLSHSLKCEVDSSIYEEIESIINK